MKDKKYSTNRALEIMKKYHETEPLFEKIKYIMSQRGIKLVINEKRYWFEYYGKQITETDLYIGSSLKRILKCRGNNIISTFEKKKFIMGSTVKKNINGREHDIFWIDEAVKVIKNAPASH
jgi:hypothetical protein